MLSAARQERRLKLREELKDAQGEIHRDPDYPQYIYHYAPASSICSILKSREIWLFDAHSMQNDPLDGRQWVDVFRCILNRKSVPPEVRFYFAPGGLLYTRWCYSLIACFSSTYELPQQWTDFADRGKGCAIEFSFDVMRERSDGGRSFGWTPMLYGGQEQVGRAEKTIDTAIRLRGRYSDLNNNDYWFEAMFSFLCCGARFKPEKYRYQDEWRIFLDRPEECEDINDFRGRAYMPISLTPDMITGVVRGPNCECSEDELAELLRISGYPVNIRTVCLTSAIAS
jgi:hypothetical protein